MQSKSTFFHFFSGMKFCVWPVRLIFVPPPTHTQHNHPLHNLAKGQTEIISPFSTILHLAILSLSLSLSLSFSPCAHLHAAPRHITHTFEHTQNPSHTLSLSLFQYTKHTGTHPLLGDLLSLSHLPIYCPLLPSHLFSLSPTLMAFKYFYALQMYRTNLCA